MRLKNLSVIDFYETIVLHLKFILYIKFQLYTKLIVL